VAGFLVLFKKEMKDHLRTFKLLIVAALFFVFGLATPLLLKYMAALLPAEAAIVLPEFTAMDAVSEYIDTVGQVGLIAAILVAMGAVAREREAGTAAMTLSKPVGCGAFIAAKLAALALTFGTGMAAGALGCYGYTLILFGNPGGFSFFAASLVAGLYLFFCLAITVMCSSFFKSQMAAGGLALVSLISLAATSGLPLLKDYSPGALIAWSRAIALGGGETPWGALSVSAALSVLAALIGWQVLKAKEL